MKKLILVLSLITLSMSSFVFRKMSIDDIKETLSKEIESMEYLYNFWDIKFQDQTYNYKDYMIDLKNVNLSPVIFDKSKLAPQITNGILEIVQANPKESYITFNVTFEIYSFSTKNTYKGEMVLRTTKFLISKTVDFITKNYKPKVYLELTYDNLVLEQNEIEDEFIQLMLRYLAYSGEKNMAKSFKEKAASQYYIEHPIERVIIKTNTTYNKIPIEIDVTFDGTYKELKNSLTQEGHYGSVNNNTVFDTDPNFDDKNEHALALNKNIFSSLFTFNVFSFEVTYDQALSITNEFRLTTDYLYLVAKDIRQDFPMSHKLKLINLVKNFSNSTSDDSAYYKGEYTVDSYLVLEDTEEIVFKFSYEFDFYYRPQYTEDKFNLKAEKIVLTDLTFKDTKYKITDILLLKKWIENIHNDYLKKFGLTYFTEPLDFVKVGLIDSGAKLTKKGDWVYLKKPIEN